jgi:RNA polymerase sigma-70 factor (subfamily 1)
MSERPAERSPGSDASVELVRRAQDGDQSALNQLFGRYYARVRRIVRVRLGAALRAQLDTSDAVQETFLAAVQGFDRFEMRDEGALVAWLAALAEQRLRDAARRQGAAKRDPGHVVALVELRRGLESGEIVLEPPGSDDTPSQLVAQGEEGSIVEEELSQLPEAARDLLLLRNVAGASWETVAERCGYRTERAARFAHSKALVELGLRVRRRGVGGTQPGGINP